MPLGFETRRMGSKKPATELVTGFSDSVVPPAGCPRAAGAARFRCVAPLLACCAGKRFAFPQLRTLSGSNPGISVAKSPSPRGYGLLNLNGAPSGIRTRGIHLERVASYAARRWGRAKVSISERGAAVPTSPGHSRARSAGPARQSRSGRLPTQGSRACP